MKKITKLFLGLSCVPLLSSCGFTIDDPNYLDIFNFDIKETFSPTDYSGEVIQTGNILSWKSHSEQEYYRVVFINDAGEYALDYQLDSFLNLTSYLSVYKQVRVEYYSGNYLEEESRNNVFTSSAFTLREVSESSETITFDSKSDTKLDASQIFIEKYVSDVYINNISMSGELKINARTSDLHIHLENANLLGNKHYTPGLSYGYKSTFNLFIHVKGDNQITCKGIYSAMKDLKNVIFIDEGGTLNVSGGNSVNQDEVNGVSSSTSSGTENGYAIEADILVNTLTNGRLSFTGGNGWDANKSYKGSDGMIPLKEGVRISGSAYGMKIKCGNGGNAYHDWSSYNDHDGGKAYTFEYLVANKYQNCGSFMVSGGVPTGAVVIDV